MTSSFFPGPQGSQVSSNQSLHNEIGNRVHDVVYQNLTGKTMTVIISGHGSCGDTVGGATADGHLEGDLGPDNTTAFFSGFFGALSQPSTAGQIIQGFGTITMIVPPNWYYAVYLVATGNLSTVEIDGWNEYY